jgi:hypothetical protein
VLFIMDRNKNYKFLKLFISILFSFLILSSPGRAQEEQLIDCLAAIVNGLPVSLFDLKVAESFRLLEADSEIYNDREKLLDEYVNHLLVLELARGQLGVSQKELAQEIDRLKKTYGEQELEEKLTALGMKENDLTPYLQNKILYDKIINSRFNQKMYVSLKEIEDYYNKIYVPEEKARGRTPAELVNALDEIEAHLQKGIL